MSYLRFVILITYFILLDGHKMFLCEDNYADRCQILKRFLDFNIDREQQALFALQALMHELEHPNSK